MGRMLSLEDTAKGGWSIPAGGMPAPTVNSEDLAECYYCAKPFHVKAPSVYWMSTPSIRLHVGCAARFGAVLIADAYPLIHHEYAGTRYAWHVGGEG